MLNFRGSFWRAATGSSTLSNRLRAPENKAPHQPAMASRLETRAAGRAAPSAAQVAFDEARLAATRGTGPQRPSERAAGTGGSYASRGEAAAKRREQGTGAEYVRPMGCCEEVSAVAVARSASRITATRDTNQTQTIRFQLRASRHRCTRAVRPETRRLCGTSLLARMPSRTAGRVRCALGSFRWSGSNRQNRGRRRRGRGRRGRGRRGQGRRDRAPARTGSRVRSKMASGVTA